MNSLNDLPHAPLADIIGRWPSSYLDDIFKALGALSLPFRNVIINPAFQVWQRGISAVAMASGTYLADRWIYTSTGAPSVRCDRIAYDPAPPLTQPPFVTPGLWYARLQALAANPATDTYTYGQRIESVRTIAGQVASLTFQARGFVTATNAGTTLTVRLRQHFGTGGTPSPDVVTAVTTVTLDPTNWQAFTASVAVPSLDGLTLGTNGDDYLALEFLPQVIVSEFHLGLVDLHAGEGTGFVEVPPLTLEYLRCARYHVQNIVNATPANQTVQLGPQINLRGYGAAGGALGESYQFPVPMRITPTPSANLILTFTNCGTPTIAAAGASGFTAQVLVTALGGASALWNASGNLGYAFTAEL